MSKTSVVSNGMSPAGVVYVQSSKLNFITEKVGEDEEERTPSRISGAGPSQPRSNLGPNAGA